MSEVKVNKISPSSGTAFTLGDSGDTFTVPSGATIVNSGTATGFGGGAWNFISNTTISSDATVLVEGLDSTYQLYQFVFMNINNDTTDNDWYLRVKSAGAVVTASDYQFAVSAWKSSGSTNTYNSQSATYMRLNANGNNTATTHTQNYIVHMYNPANTSVWTNIATSSGSYVQNDDVVFAMFGAGVWEATAAVTGLELSASSGTFSSGNIYLYGLAIS